MPPLPRLPELLLLLPPPLLLLLLLLLLALRLAAALLLAGQAQAGLLLLPLSLPRRARIPVRPRSSPRT